MERRSRSRRRRADGRERRRGHDGQPHRGARDEGRRAAQREGRRRAHVGLRARRERQPRARRERGRHRAWAAHRGAAGREHARRRAHEPAAGLDRHVPGHPRPALRGRAREERRRPRAVDDARDGGRTVVHVHVRRPEARHLPLPERLAPRRAGADGPVRRADDGRRGGGPVRDDARLPAGLRRRRVRGRGPAAVQRDRPGPARGRGQRDLRHARRPDQHHRLQADAVPHQRRVVHRGLGRRSRGLGQPGGADAAALPQRGPAHPRSPAGQRRPEDRRGGRQQAAVREGPGGPDAGGRQDARRALEAVGRGHLQPVRPHAEPERAGPGRGGHAGPARRRRGRRAGRGGEERLLLDAGGGGPQRARERGARQRHGQPHDGAARHERARRRDRAGRRRRRSATRRPPASSASTPSATGRAPARTPARRRWSRSW